MRLRSALKALQQFQQVAFGIGDVGQSQLVLRDLDGLDRHAATACYRCGDRGIEVDYRGPNHRLAGRRGRRSR